MAELFELACQRYIQEGLEEWQIIAEDKDRATKLGLQMRLQCIELPRKYGKK